MGRRPSQAAGLSFVDGQRAHRANRLGGGWIALSLLNASTHAIRGFRKCQPSRSLLMVRVSSRLFERYIHTGHPEASDVDQSATLVRLPGQHPTRRSPSAHSNGLGFFRLLFALLVIFSHGYHDPLFLITGVVSFGDIAVDGFFCN